jgi:hypothetical protein
MVSLQSLSVSFLFLIGLSSLLTPILAQTSCPTDISLTRLNDPQPPQTATFLDLDFTCIYNDFATDGISYQFVPAPFIRVEPGDDIAIYSNPPNIYDSVDRDGDNRVVSLAHNNVTALTFATTTQPVPTFLVITWPAEQLERLRVGTINATLLLAEGFTNLKELNVTGRRGGLEAVLSTNGTIRLRMTGENLVGRHIVASESTQLEVYIEMGEENVEINATAPNSISGEVHAIRNNRRTGNVSLAGVKSIVSTGQGPGMLLADDCSKVQGNCHPFNGTMQSPNPDCRLTNTCLVTVFTRTKPGRTCTGQFPPEDNGGSCTSDNTIPSTAYTKMTNIAFHLQFGLFVTIIQFLPY